MERKANMKQCGVIVYGGGLNARAWIDEAKAAGYAPVTANCGSREAA